MVLDIKEVEVELSKKSIIRNVSLRVEEGGFIGLIGPNGCGKSTLLRTVYKMLKPKAGSIVLYDMDLVHAPFKEVAKMLGVVGQFNEMRFDLTVMEMVLMGRAPYKKFMESDHQVDVDIAKDALSKVGLSGFEERSYQTLSGGEKQRVILARVITQQPKFLVLDEPTNHLDIYYQIEILSIVKSLGIGVLAALHDLSLAAMFTDYIYFMKNGEIITNGASEEVLTSQNISEVFGVRAEIFKNPFGHLSVAYNVEPIA
ncbi:ABC transporter ATP-binding protein [Lachnospiraceae bacterium ZAX-1]